MESTIAYSPFPAKRTAPGAVTVQHREIAYTIKSPHFDDFHVMKSANAWWMDRTKVEKIIDAFKQGHLVETARFYAGVSRRQWEYFNIMHPTFCEVVEQIESQPMYLKAVNSIANAMDTKPELAMSYLRATHPKFASKKVEEPAPLQPSVRNNVVIATNIDAGTITDAIRAIAREVFAPPQAGAGTDTRRAD